MLVAKEISIGLAAGLLLTVAAGWLLKFAWRQQWLTETWIQIPIVALALVCFATAQLLGSSGFIAAFSGGLLFGALAKKHRQEFLRTAEGTGDTLALITWVIFGAAMSSRPDRVGRHPFYRTDGCRIGACGSGKHEGNAEA